MPISTAHQLVFVHIPKTSGTYIEAAFGMHGDKERVGLEETSSLAPNEFLWGAEYQHLTISEISKILPSRMLERFFSFSIVRNPYDRIVSEIAWRNGYKNWQTETAMTEDVFSNQLGVLYELFSQDRRFLDGDRHLMHQHRFVMRDGQIGVDRIFRYEEYDEINSFIRKLGAEPPIQKRMMTRRLPTEAYLTEEHKRQICEMYSDDFRYFNYSR